MDSNELFFRVYQDLAKKCKSNDTYELLRCGHLIRQLLLDTTTLVSQVKVANKPKINFHIVHMDKLPEGLPVPTVRFHMTSGKDFRGRGLVLDLNIDQFLRARMGEVLIDGKVTGFTVRDFIKYVSNKYGAVHLDKNKTKYTEGDHAVDLALSTIKSADVFLKRKGGQLGLGSELLMLRSLSLVVLEALEPLYLQISKQTEPLIIV